MSKSKLVSNSWVLNWAAVLTVPQQSFYIPRFTVGDDSYVDAFETQTSTGSAMSRSSFSAVEAEASVYVALAPLQAFSNCITGKVEHSVSVVLSAVAFLRLRTVL